MTGFAHHTTLGTTTLSEIMRVRSAVSADLFFGCFAYATQSGFRSFELRAGRNFWKTTSSRWLFSIDYGRTDPRALREIAKRANAEVRIFDGLRVVDRAGFLPHRDFHPKVAMMENTTSGAQGIVLGSGNFSYNGLERSVEAGSATVASTTSTINQHVRPVQAVFEALWKDACPMNAIIDKYEACSTELVRLRDTKRLSKPKGSATGFWIEAGYVTKNRGLNRPGNQIFAPTGFHGFFGLKKGKASSNMLGQVTFLTPIGADVTKNLRENVNGMEKLTMPTPENHGFGVYDGKILVFQPEGTKFSMKAMEPEEFEMAYGHRVANVGVMSRGRRFGALV